MNARESLVHAVYPEAEGPGTNELIAAFEAEVLRRGADLIDAGGPACKCGGCRVSRANAAALRHEADLTDGTVPTAGRDGISTADDGDRIVAYRAPSLLFLCRTCCHGGGAAFTPVTSDDLIDGAMCANCGNDVLIDPPVPTTGQDDTTTKGKDTGDATQAPAGESTQAAPGQDDATRVGMTVAKFRALLAGGEPGVTRRTEYALQDADEPPYPIAARDPQEAALIAADYPDSRIVQRTVITTTTPWTKAGEAR